MLRTKREIYEVNCQYLPICPLERGWKIAYQDEGAQPFFRAPLEPPGIGGLALEVDKKYAIRLNVPPEYAALADELELAIRYGTSESIMTMGMFSVEVNVTSRDAVSQSAFTYSRYSSEISRPNRIKLI